jgi:phosphonate transport system substrate-binding protein
MPKINLTVSPDFNPDKIAGWYIFNTWFQKNTGLDIHLELYDSFDAQREAIQSGKVDLIYANPYDSAMLVHDLKFQALVKPKNKPDEAVIVTSQESPVNQIDDLPEGTRIAATDDPDINMIGMRTIESADLDQSNTVTETVVSYIVVAKQVINGKADIGFFLKDAYDDLSDFVKGQLKVLVTSQISVISHAFMAGPNVDSDQKQKISTLLTDMESVDKGQGILDALGLDGWTAMSEEDAEFMIDLMETLRD